MYKLVNDLSLNAIHSRKTDTLYRGHRYSEIFYQSTGKKQGKLVVLINFFGQLGYQFTLMLLINTSNHQMLH
tara:strand:+ start:894 stop:1109 length:216 start_codon:yes stop_codon:yes gene_type:complete